VSKARQDFGVLLERQIHALNTKHNGRCYGCSPIVDDLLKWLRKNQKRLVTKRRKGAKA
jgi:hypothetical protein